MKTKVYHVTNGITSAYHVYSVLPSGEETLLKAYVYDETKENKEIWGKERAYKEAIECAKKLEYKDTKELVYETGSDDTEGCVNHETE